MLKSVGFFTVQKQATLSLCGLFWDIHGWIRTVGERVKKSCCQCSFVHIVAIVPIAFSASLLSLSSGELSPCLFLCCFPVLVRSLPPNEAAMQAFPAVLFYGVSLFCATLF
jgi:hypothetical protein